MSAESTSARRNAARYAAECERRRQALDALADVDQLRAAAPIEVVAALRALTHDDLVTMLNVVLGYSPVGLAAAAATLASVESRRAAARAAL